MYILELIGNIFNDKIKLVYSHNAKELLNVNNLGFEEEKNKVGRPKLADKETKRKSLIIAVLAFFGVTLLLIFGYGTLFGFKSFDLKGMVNNTEYEKDIPISEIKPLVKSITIKEGTARKVYLTVLPSSATNKIIKYESRDPSVATVDKNGKVVGVSPGKTVITASTTDGSSKSTSFDIKVIKNGNGGCLFSSLSKTGNRVDYSVTCDNAKVKEIQYSVGDDNYHKLLTKKLSDSVSFSENQLNENITFKVVYYPNNSNVSKYKTKKLASNKKTTSKKVDGICDLTIKEVGVNSVKYDVTCNNASVSKIAYKIGNGSYVGIEPSNLADTIIFEESDITRIIYFNLEYTIDGTDINKTVSKNSIIQSAVTEGER